MLQAVTPFDRTPSDPGTEHPVADDGDEWPRREDRVALRRYAPVLAAALAGLAVTVAFPPTDVWWAAPLGLALFMGAVRGRSMWTGAGLGLVFGLAFFAPLLHFTAVAMGNPIGWAALTLVQALYMVVLGAAWALVSRVSALTDVGPGAGHAVTARIVSFTVLWCGVEELRSSWPWGGFPFGRLAFAMADAPLLPFAAYTGSIGLTLLVALIGACLAEIIRAMRARAVLHTLAAVTCAGLALVLPLTLPVDSVAEKGGLKVGAVQGNVADDVEDAFGRAMEVTGNHAQATKQLADDAGRGGLDVVIWPENAADLDPRIYPAAADLIDASARAVGTQIVVGTVLYADRNDERVRYNDMLVWTPGEGPGPYYRKHRPVPFAEYVPLRGLIERVTDQADRIGTDMASGTGPQTLVVHAATQDRDVNLAMGICFEVAYDSAMREGIRQGGELIVIPTNNASFLSSSEADQQLAQGRVQAVVHGRGVVQVSTVGITAIISPRGIVEQEIPPYTQGSLVADVGLRTSITVADALGDWPGLVLRGSAALLTAAGIVSAVRRLFRSVRADRHQ